jgi:N-acyl-D-amino-acid deacylase
VGHNTLRRESGIGYDTPTAAERRALAGLVAQGLDAGAFGLSTGLEYDPGTQAQMPELVAIAEPVAERDAVVMSHIRSEDAADIEASIAELLEQGRRAGAHVHASHLKIVLSDDASQAAAVLDQMADAREDGPAVTADIYPYTASFTGISILFPEWARPPNDYETVLNTRTDELRTYLTRRVRQRNGPDATLFGTGQWTGLTLAEVADSTGRSPAEVLMDLGPDGPSAAYFVMDEAVMNRFLAAEHTVVSSDGSPTMHHPRGHGAFARVLARHTGPDALLRLNEAVHKMTGRTASIVDLDDPTRVRTPRGLVREGYAADLLAFDPEAVQDRATFSRPHRRARGMERVWVNGTLTWAVDALTTAEGAGGALRARYSP